MKNIFMGLCLAYSFNFLSCSSGKHEKPKLVIMLVVDQLRPDLLTRFDDLYVGGFRWLIDNGIWFTNTHHEHSYTATGPGHAAIGFGQHPGKIGVIGNSFYDRDLKKKVNCVEDPSAKVVGSSYGIARSFSRYDSKGMGDWLKEKYPQSKVISIAGKDRSACMAGGKNPDLPLYYNYHGQFITSDYYVDTLPEWVTNFNEKLNIESYSDSLWKKSLKNDMYLKYAREDHFEGETDNYLNAVYSPVFPIGFDRDVNPKNTIMGRPWFERIVLELSKKAIVDENLGKDLNPDLLAIGFSAMDWMIHDYGPYSQEVMDACIRLDKYLDDFIQHVDNIVGLNNVLFVLTSDHGGLPLPEYILKNGGQAGRINKKHLEEALQWIDEECEEKFAEKIYHRDGANFFLDMKTIKNLDIDPEIIYDMVGKYLSEVDGIDRVVIKDKILKSSDNDKITRRLKNMLHIHKSPEIFPIVNTGYLYRGPHGTSHGTPYDYDTHVPLIFSREQFRKFKNNSPHATVDIASTIARYLDIPVPDYADGIPIDF